MDDLPPLRLRDRLGTAVQLVLTLLGAHVFLAMGFEGQAYRHPFVGLLLILLGFELRRRFSPRYFARVRTWQCVDLACLRAFSQGNAPIPWRPAIAWVAFPALLLYSLNDRTIGSGDTRPMLLLAHSIVAEQNCDLDEYFGDETLPYYAVRVDGVVRTSYPYGPAICAVPFVAINQLLGGRLDDPDLRLRFEKVIASVIAAAVALLTFLTLCRVTDLTTATWLIIWFVLGTQNWSTASQGLWQHGPLALCVSLILFAEVALRPQRGTMANLLQGACFGLAFACRPTIALFIMAWLAYAAWRHRWAVAAIVLAASHGSTGNTTVRCWARMPAFKAKTPGDRMQPRSDLRSSAC